MKLASRRSRKTKTLANYLESLSQDNQIHRMRNGYSGISASAITSDSLSDEITLVDKAIQSSTYLSGEAGWRIEGSGDAEFSNVFVRGDINAESGTIGYWNISSPVVTRTFGESPLKGTFLESYDYGASDVDATTGAYVSLYKSYESDEISFNAFSVRSTFVTIYSYDHGYAAGDLVSVTFNDTGYQANLGSTDTSGADTFEILLVDDYKYMYQVKNGFNANSIYDSQYTYIEASGSSYEYVPDVAGLYLRDYGLKNFNYGYFSNKGIRFSSPDAVNFIYNPSFESGEIANNASVSNAGSWSNSNVSSATFSTANIAMLTQTRTGVYTGQFARTSNFAANVSWTTTAPTDNRLVSLVDYSSIIYYNKIYSGTRLYLNMGVFFDYQPSIAAAKNVSSATYNTNGNLTVVMGAAVAGYFAAGDYVLLDFDGKDGEVDMVSRVAANVALSTQPSAFERIFKVINVSGSNLYIDIGTGPADEGATGTVTLASRLNRDGTTRTRRVHKVVYPQYDLSEITINFGGGSGAVALANVLTDSSAEAWANGYNKYYTVADPSQYMDYLVDTSTAANVGPIITSLTPAANIESDGVVVVDGKKLYDEYYRVNPTGLSNQNAISIRYPTWFYQGSPFDASSTNVKITANTITVGNIAAYFDSFNFGTFPSGFYGDTKNQSGSYAWANSISAPNTISYASGTEWVNIDVDTQDVLYDGIDYLGFSNQDFPHALKKRAAVTTYLGTSPTAFTAGGGGEVGTGAIPSPDSFRVERIPSFSKNAGKAIDIGLFPSDSYYMRFDGGVLRDLDPDATTSNVRYLEYNSYVNTILSQTSTGVEIAAKKTRVTYDLATDTDTTDTANTISASIIAYVTPEDFGKIIVKGQMALDANKNEATLSSKNHPFQIGLSSDSNLRVSTHQTNGTLPYSKIQSVNNGVASRLYINTEGGTLYLGSGSNVLIASGGGSVDIGTRTGGGIDIGGGDVSNGPTTNFGGLLASNDTYTNDITATRRAMWIQSNGAFGYASSSRTKKQDIVSANLDVSSILSIDPVKFKYIKAVEEEGDAAKVEVGFIAEDLHDAGLTQFVDYGNSGNPEGIHYQTYVVALQAVVREQQRQIDELSVRIQNGGL